MTVPLTGSVPGPRREKVNDSRLMDRSNVAFTLVSTSIRVASSAGAVVVTAGGSSLPVTKMAST